MNFTASRVCFGFLCSLLAASSQAQDMWGRPSQAQTPQQRPVYRDPVRPTRVLGQPRSQDAPFTYNPAVRFSSHAAAQPAPLRATPIRSIAGGFPAPQASGASRLPPAGSTSWGPRHYQEGGVAGSWYQDKYLNDWCSNRVANQANGWRMQVNLGSVNGAPAMCRYAQRFYMAAENHR